MTVPDAAKLRKISALTVVGTVVFLVLATIFPRLTTILATLAIIVYSVGFASWAYIWPRKRSRRRFREIFVRELTHDMLVEWHREGRLTEEEFARMLRNVESQT